MFRILVHTYKQNDTSYALKASQNRLGRAATTERTVSPTRSERGTAAEEDKKKRERAKPLAIDERRMNFEQRQFLIFQRLIHLRTHLRSPDWSSGQIPL